MSNEKKIEKVKQRGRNKLFLGIASALVSSTECQNIAQSKVLSYSINKTNDKSSIEINKTIFTKNGLTISQSRVKDKIGDTSSPDKGKDNPILSKTTHNSINNTEKTFPKKDAFANPISPNMDSIDNLLEHTMTNETQEKFESNLNVLQAELGDSNIVENILKMGRDGHKLKKMRKRKKKR